MMKMRNTPEARMAFSAARAKVLQLAKEIENEKDCQKAFTWIWSVAHELSYELERHRTTNA